MAEPHRGPLAAIAAAAAHALKSYATGPDGRSYAPGRAMAAAVFVVGQCLVIRATQTVLAARPTVEAWGVFFGSVSTFEAAICATCVGLVLGIAPADPGGKWWGRDNHPPPPPEPPAA